MNPMPDEKQTKPLVSIVILTWNSARFMDTCLESLSRQAYHPFEVIIVDNASTDGTLARIEASPWRPVVARIITNPCNLGCAGGNNVGWKSSNGRIVIFLNPDTVVTRNWLDEMVRGIEARPDAGVAGCKIYYPNSRVIQHAGGILHPNAMTDHIGNGLEDKGQFDEEREVDYVTGAAFAVRREVLDALQGLDEDYHPAYYEETDLCWRAREKGWKVIYLPGALLYHYESPGLVKFSPGFYATYYRMRVRFLIKNYGIKRLLKDYLPFELRWMLREPRARHMRLRQVRAWAEGFAFLFKRLWRSSGNQGQK